MKNIIKNYINNLTLDEVKAFIEKSHYDICDDDAKIIFYYIKHYPDEILDDKKEIFEMFKKEVSDSTYQTVMKLCDKYKKML